MRYSTLLAIWLMLCAVSVAIGSCLTYLALSAPTSCERALQSFGAIARLVHRGYFTYDEMDQALRNKHYWVKRCERGA